MCVVWFVLCSVSVTSSGLCGLRCVGCVVSCTVSLHWLLILVVLSNSRLLLILLVVHICLFACFVFVCVLCVFLSVVISDQWIPGTGDDRYK